MATALEAPASVETDDRRGRPAEVSRKHPTKTTPGRRSASALASYSAASAPSNGSRALAREKLSATTTGMCVLPSRSMRAPIPSTSSHTPSVSFRCGTSEAAAAAVAAITSASSLPRRISTSVFFFQAVPKIQNR